MKLFQLAGAAALCGALLLTACAKKADQSTTTSTDTTQAGSATTAPDAAAPANAAATTMPAATASTAPGEATVTTGGTTVSTSSGNGASSGYIDLPVYPGAAESKDQGMAMSSNGTSVAMKVYTTKDDPKSVSDWYKSHLPASWKNGILTAGGKTVGTFANERTDGDQSVIVSNQDDGTSRIQLTTKHGK